MKLNELYDSWQLKNNNEVEIKIRNMQYYLKTIFSNNVKTHETQTITASPKDRLEPSY
jgi:hypothetical protein